MSRVVPLRGVLVLAAGLVVAGGVSLIGPALADSVLHEYIHPDPAEDLRFGATTTDGLMPAAIDTESGPVSSPETSQPRPREGTGASRTVSARARASMRAISSRASE
jgi:hypothetical protein